MVNDTYFAAQDSKDTASSVLSKTQGWANNVVLTSYLEKCRSSWRAYHGAYYTDAGSGHQVLFGGEQGELVQLAVNHYRNIGTHLLNLTTSNRPSMEARASNTDAKSLIQTKLANGLLDYYIYEKRLEEYLRRAAEYAIVLGEGYIKIEWDSSGGEEYGYNEELKSTVYNGDIKFTNLSPFDVIRDASREDQNHDWLIVRSYRNRFELTAKYPDLRDKIMGVKSKDALDNGGFFTGLGTDETDLIPIYEFYHKRNDAVPDGRYMIIITSDAVAYDGALPYRDIPVYRMSPSDILGTPLGYTMMFDLIPIQETINSLYSTVSTNQNAFGVQNVLSPKGSGLTTSNLGGGLNLIEYEASQGKPESLNLTNTPVEIFNTIQKLESVLETLSGINQVVRGNPEASLRSGAALALVQAQAIQFASGLQQSYVRLIEDVGTAMIRLLQDFATTPRVATIVGKSNKSYIKEFTGADLAGVNRVKVNVGNALSKTIGGRLEIATTLMDKGIITTGEDYIQVLTTGSLEAITDPIQNETILMKAENERLMDGAQVIVLPTDQHSKHIKAHLSVLNDPDLRMDPDLTTVVLAHIQEHIEALKTVDPALLQMMGQTPLPPDGGPLPGQGGANPAPGGGAPGGDTAAAVQQPPPGGVAEAGAAMEAQMPTVNSELLPRPDLQQESMGNVNP